MEIVCSRCHQTVRTEDCYCPVCGLPQFVYSADETAAPIQPERWNEAVRDASSVAWKPALRAAMVLAVPAGLLCSGFPYLGFYGLLWMLAAGTWAVVLYMRSQRPAWITIGAGARIGLVTGILGGWIAAASMAFSLFAMRVFFHQGKVFDDAYQQGIVDKMVEQWVATGRDAHGIAVDKAELLSPTGRGALTLTIVLMLTVVLLVFATAGGALGARLMGRTRRPEV
jgi:RNA polymerase subunit RPABC4/transcription elongation factor Spt4